MKNAIGILAVLAFTASAANAQLLKNFKYDGQIEVNAYSNSNQDFNKSNSDKKSFVDTRLLLNAGFDLNEDVNAVVTAVKNDRQYGQASQNANNIQDNLYFEQAYLNLKGVFGIDHKVGRQFYGDAGDMVIYYGPKMWPYPATLPVSAIDGWTGWYKFNAVNRDWDVNAIVAKQTQNNAGAAAGLNDINVTGVNVKTKVEWFNLNAYYYQKVAKTNAAGATTQNADYLGLAGIRANWECKFVKDLNLGLEYDQNTGKDTNYPAIGYKHQGYAFKANANYSLDLAGKLGFAGEYVLQSGDETNNSADKAFKGINGDYRPGIIYGGGFMTSAALNAGSGLNTYNLGANWTPSKLEKLNVAVTYYDFSANKQAGLTSKKHIGNEGDLVATWTHSEKVDVKGYYAMFSPEKKNLVGSHDTETMLGAALNVKF